MTDTLRLFTTESLFAASSALLDRLGIAFDRETAQPISVADFYDTEMPKYLAGALTHIKATYFIGIANDDSLRGEKNEVSLEDVKAETEREGRYDGMMIFACDAERGAEMTRSDIAALTRGFNRAACACPVILIVRQTDHITLSTCERTEYSQEWRRNNGERVGKVSILRNINCRNPHRGHLNILESIGEERFDNFEKLYNHWKEKFSNELLTKKFYSELSDWYAWAVQIARFPNDLSTKVDDQKFNHESCIRLITRLIFVWFLKQKRLIPRELFDEGYIRDNFIDNFDPHDRCNMLYDAEKSRYYRLILQNLFFAMLNCPIVAEGKNTPNNRRFMTQKTYHGINPDHNINNIMRYETEFKEGGNRRFLQLANRYVPFLNGGLFDCLDNKSTNIYYDGFSESQKSLDSLYLPDYLFFGEEVGNGIDLSKWYGDAKKKKVSARGIIDILGRYSFTVEENTPLEQEVSLDPELLGKVFENLLAAYNPETQTSARKQTGSFYTPREIVQYMVDESLVAHLKRKCGDRNEELYRSLVSYSSDDVSIDEGQRKEIVEALYDCRVLDPACGSGAFPMGVLQQMVHVLKKVDPSNELWNKKVVDISVEEARKELLKATEARDKEQIEKEREARLADIEEAFNNAINYPDYARKLFLIEHCIHGVDIQPIATQISKLRFFISLVVDQKPTDDPKSNFGIRPLPNLESKFVSANTLIPLDREPNLFDSMPEILEYEKQLEELSHRIFLSKRNAEKQRLRDELDNTRMMMAMALRNNGFLGPDGYGQLVEWNMFDQNSSARFFDPEWMFGVKDGFDIVIGNPPYISALEAKKIFGEELRQKYKETYESASGAYDLYVIFFECGIKLLQKNATLFYITPSKYLSAEYAKSLRKIIINSYSLDSLSDFSNVRVFENAGVSTIITQISNNEQHSNVNINVYQSVDLIKYSHKLNSECLTVLDENIWGYLLSDSIDVFLKVIRKSNILHDFAQINACSTASEAELFENSLVENCTENCFKYINNGTINRYVNYWGFKRIKKNNLLTPYLPYHCVNERRIKMFTSPKLIFVKLAKFPEVFYDDNGVFASANTNMVYDIKKYDYKFLLAYFNSNIYYYVYRTMFGGLSMLGSLQFQAPQIRLSYIPNIFNLIKVQSLIEQSNKKVDGYAQMSEEIDKELSMIFYHIYELTYNEVLKIDPQTPITREEYDNYRIE